jgi:hypothetical protein
LASPQLRRKKEPWTNLSCPIDKKKSIFGERETVKGISSREKICSLAPKQRLYCQEGPERAIKQSKFQLLANGTTATYGGLVLFPLLLIRSVPPWRQGQKN